MKNLVRVSIQALKKSHKIYNFLGEKGKEDICKNRFGEKSLLADINCENAVLDILKEESIPIKVYSEENGEVSINKNTKYLGVLDGIDGTHAYLTGKGMHGTLFAILKGNNPKYKDYLFCGMIEHSTDTLIYATKENKGIMKKGEFQKLPEYNKKKNLDKEIVIFIDEFWKVNRDTFSKNLKGYNIQECPKSITDSISNILLGKGDLFLGCTRKGNLEFAVFYGLIKEFLNGTIETLNGEELGEKEYLKFGQKEYIPLITSSNKNLADSLRDFLKYQK